MSVFNKLKSISNVAASSTAVLSDLPLGMTYLGILLKLGGTTFTKAHLTEIRAYLGSKMFWQISGTDLDKINKQYKLANDAAYLLIPFYTPNARTLGGEMIGAVDTSIHSSFGLEFDIGAATAPTLEAYALWAPPKAANDPFKATVKAMLRASHSLASASEHDLKIPLGSKNGGLIKAIHLTHTNVTRLDVKKDGLELQGKADTAPLQFVQGQLNRTAQSGLISFDPAHSDNMSEVVSTLRQDGQKASFEMLATTSGADTVKSYTEMFTQIELV